MKISFIREPILIPSFVLLISLFVVVGCIEHQALEPQALEEFSVSRVSSQRFCVPESSRALKPNRILVANLNELKVSIDNGDTFSTIKSVDIFEDPPNNGYGQIVEGNVLDVAITNSGTWIVATTSGMSISSDDGLSFKNIKFPFLSGLQNNSIFPLEDGTFILLHYDKIARYDDRGNLLAVIYKKGPQEYLDAMALSTSGEMVISVSKIMFKNALGAVMGSSLFISKDCGKSFSATGISSTRAKYDTVKVIKFRGSDEIVVGSVNGILRSVDQGESFVSITKTANNNDLGSIGDLLFVDDDIYLGTRHGIAKANISDYQFVNTQVNSKYGIFDVPSLAFSADLGIVFNNWGLVTSTDFVNFTTLNKSPIDGIDGIIASKIVIK